MIRQAPLRRASVHSQLYRFFLVAVLFLAAAAIPRVSAQTFSVVHTFSGADGSTPNGDMIRDPAGNLYGTTQTGGSLGFGVVFRLDSSGNETVLYNFSGGTDGGLPLGGMVRDNSGNLYGLTEIGGASSCGCGVLFELLSNGTLRVLHAFLGGTDGMESDGQPGQGLLPVGGELYGVTYLGGMPGCDGDFGCGTIFKITMTGEETVIYRFTGAADGAFPQALISDGSGNLYGVTGGGYDDVSDGGGVFKLDTTGHYSVLYNFPGGDDGSRPMWRLTAVGSNTLYGTTFAGGSSNCAIGPCGVVYSLDTTNATETLWHEFGDVSADGVEPSGPLLDVAGDFYGTTYYGGIINSQCDLGCGVVYGLGSSDTYKEVYRFTGGADGASPNGALVEDSEGSLYGAAASGGNNHNGVIFKISR